MISARKGIVEDKDYVQLFGRSTGHYLRVFGWSVDDGICELDIWESPHVAQVDNVRAYPEGREAEWHLVDEECYELDADDGINRLDKDLPEEDGMLFDDLAEIVQSRGYKTYAR